MNILKTAISAIILGGSALSMAAQQQAEPWLHIYFSDMKEFYSVPMEQVGEITFNANVVTGRATKINAGSVTLDLDGISSWYIGANVPRLYITTDTPVTEIPDKTNYLYADLWLDGMGVTDDVTSRVMIRGRGNSTWNYPKKPYRLKFDQKTSLYGYKKAKNYCLLANYIDGTLMKNLAAGTALQLLGVPGAFHAVPVDVYLNDEYKGSYMLTEKMGFNAGCIDMTKEQEAQSVLFELDANFDDDVQFISSSYRLPVIIKDPDLPTDPAEADAWTAKWTADFLQMESAVHSGADLSEVFDYESLARYLIAFNICCNQELNHPKSVYLHKTEGGKYIFGPGWDFDWAFGFDPTYHAAADKNADQLHEEAMQYFQNGSFAENQWHQLPDGTWVLWFYGEVYVQENGKLTVYPGNANLAGPSYKAPLLGTGSNVHTGNMGYGGEFFLDIVRDNAEFMDVYARVWDDFYTNQLDSFWEQFNAYERTLRPSAASNGTMWGSGLDLAKDVDELRQWIKNRIEYINNPSVNYGLFNK